jgi:long-chain acyl-CoA synthetase
MIESLSEFFAINFHAQAPGHAYGQRRGYRMQWFTYGQVYEMAVAFSRELKRRQIVKGDRVMLWGENSAEWVAAFFACAMRGVIVVPMDDAATPDFVQRVILQVEAKLLVCSRGRNADSQEIAAAPSAAAVSNVPILLFDDLSKTLTSLPVAPDVPLIAVEPNDILQIVFTSGTTADPRGVVITHGNVLANIAPLEERMRAYMKYERWVHPVRFLSLLPLSHVFGQFLGMFLPPLMGGTVIFQEELKPSEIMDTIRRERVSVLVCVPRIMQSLKQKTERDVEQRGEVESFKRKFHKSEGKHFLRRWWTFRAIRRQFGWKFWAFITGGAALDADTEKFWDRLGYAAIQGYGLTETTSLISVNHPFRLGKGSIGKVLPGREVKLAADGEILVRGGGVASGYWDGHSKKPLDSKVQDQSISDEDGWYRTGDLGALDEAGNLYFKGRKKEVIITPAGMNIYPDDLETALRRQSEVKDCAVVGIERDGNAEPCAVIILRDGGQAQEVVRKANQSLAGYQQIRMWIEWPEQDFPRTNTQKPRKNLIREYAQRQQTTEASLSWSDTSQLTSLIASVSSRPLRNLNANSSLDADLGLSSLDRVELLSALEDRYQVDLSETRFSAARTVGDLERMLRGEAVERAEFHYPNWALRWPVTWLRLLAHYLLLRPAVFLLGWPRIEGREHLRGVQGPVLVISNHIGDVDAGFILTALPARFRNRIAIAAGGEALELLRTPAPGRGFFGQIYDRVQWIMGAALLNLFPLPRAAGFRRSFAYAGEAVDHGYNLLVFPEGKHTTDGNMNPFRAGIGLLASNLGIPVLPMRINGLFELKHGGKRFALPGKISVRIGKPIKFATGIEPEKIAAELQRAVEEV